MYGRALVTRTISASVAMAVVGLLGGCSLLLAPVSDGGDGSRDGHDAEIADGDADSDVDRDVDNDVDSDCTPVCLERECGSDGCGGWCQPGCLPGQRCSSDGLCQCIPDCSDRECGPDGCDGPCPPGCRETEVCNVSGRCGCISDCAELPCGGPDGCGGICPSSCPGICCSGECFPEGECCTDAQCGGCLGDGVRCSDLRDQASCQAQGGCTWGSGCISPDRDVWCAELPRNRCAGCGCRWSGMFDVCYSSWIGSPIDCTTLGDSSCSSCGCSLTSGCTGSASSCELYSVREACESQVGCHWRGCVDHRCVEGSVPG